MNFERMLQLADHIEQNGKVDMSVGIKVGIELPNNATCVGDTFELCGTAACMAGWAVLLFTPGIKMQQEIEVYKDHTHNYRWITIQSEAQRILDLQAWDANRLFYLMHSIVRKASDIK